MSLTPPSFHNYLNHPLSLTVHNMINRWGTAQKQISAVRSLLSLPCSSPFGIQTHEGERPGVQVTATFAAVSCAKWGFEDSGRNRCCPCHFVPLPAISVPFVIDNAMAPISSKV